MALSESTVTLIQQIICLFLLFYGFYSCLYQFCSELNIFTLVNQKKGLILRNLLFGQFSKYKLKFKSFLVQTDMKMKLFNVVLISNLHYCQLFGVACSGKVHPQPEAPITVWLYFQFGFFQFDVRTDQGSLDFFGVGRRVGVQQGFLSESLVRNADITVLLYMNIHIVIQIYIDYFVVMDPSRATYARYWQPNLLVALGLSTVAGAVATAVTYPMDYIKTVSQYRAEGLGLRGQRFKPWQLGYNPFALLREMHARGGGFSQFYEGFQAAFAARIGYLLIRNTLYKTIYDQVKPVKPYNDLTNRQKMWISGFSGGVAALVTSPLSLISIRQILDSQTRPEWRRNYQSIGDGLNKLGNQKYQGAFENVVRHVLLNITLTGPFDYFHEALYLRFGDYGFVRPLAIFLASLTSAALTLPFDNARTRIMNAHSDPSRNRLNYKGMLDVFGKSFLHEKSNFALWAGFFAYFGSTLVYASLTVGITSGVSNALKRANGLKEWQI